MERLDPYLFGKSHSENPLQNHVYTTLKDSGYEVWEAIEIIDNVTHSVRINNRYLQTLDQYPKNIFKFIHSSVENPEISMFVATCFLNEVGSMDGEDTTARIIRELAVWTKGDADSRIGALGEKIQQVFSGAWCNDQFRLGLQIIRDADIFDIFENKIETVGNFIKDFCSIYASSPLASFLQSVHRSPNKKIFLRGLTQLSISQVCDHSQYNENDVSKILNNRKYAEHANYLLTSVTSWDKKIKELPKTIELMGYPMVRSEQVEESLLNDFVAEFAKSKGLNLSDIVKLVDELSPQEKYKNMASMHYKIDSAPKMIAYKKALQKSVSKYELADSNVLDRVRKRESLVYPLNTLNIAKTVGYEIEFQRDNVTIPMIKNGLMEMLAIGGIRLGLGNNKTYETSPGPFYDPQTANLVFKMFNDVGLIDLTKYTSFTYHFNVGADTRHASFVPLLRAMYLTGAAYNSNNNFSEKELRIHGNLSEFGAYIECKAFDVITRDDFIWNMKSASYLSWALDANFKSRVLMKEPSPWHTKLAEIWSEYIRTLRLGLASTEIGSEYLDEYDHGELSAMVRKQLNLIFPTKSSRYKDISLVGLDNSNILGVELDGGHWPNLAYFARWVTDRIVYKIEALADSVEASAVEDIYAIEKTPARARKVLIAEFCKKYKSFSYEEVRSLLIGA